MLILRTALICESELCRFWTHYFRADRSPQQFQEDPNMHEDDQEDLDQREKMIQELVLTFILCVPQ